MPQFSSSSKARLAKAHPLMQKVLNEAIQHFDFKISESQRGKEAQEAAVRGGFSKVHYPNSAHNWDPAPAVDLYPMPVDFKNIRAFEKLAVVMKAAAAKVGVKIRWGADWNMNNRTDDEKFRDYPHYELHPWRDYKGKPYVE